jgi:spastin
VGEAEKLVRTLFIVAISRQPSVIFMDEVCYSFSKLFYDGQFQLKPCFSSFILMYDVWCLHLFRSRTVD